LTEAGRLVEFAGDVVGAGEKAEALALRDVLEKKQAIVNEVEAGRRAGDFEEEIFDISEQLKTEFENEPDKAPDKLLERARAVADQRLQDATTAEVRLNLAQRTQALTNSAMRKMHAWTLARQTQKAKGDLTTIINRATAGARGVNSPAELSEFIAAKEQELSGTFTNLLGSDAPKKMQEMKTNMARGWVFSHSDRDPIGTIAALKANEGPLVDHLDVSQRQALEKDARASLEGRSRQRDVEAIIDGVRKNDELYASFVDGSLDGATIFQKQQALKEQKGAAEAELSLDLQELAALGIDPQGLTPKEVVNVIDEQLAYVDAIDRVRRRQLALDAPEDPASEEALMEQVNRSLTKATSASDMVELVRQHTRLAEAIRDKKISGSRATSLFRTMSHAVQKAAEDQGGLQNGLWGPNAFRLWRAPYETGIAELNNQFGTGIFAGGAFENLDKASQVRVRFNYVNAYNDALQAGQEVSRDDARRMALRTLAVEIGEPIPGVD